MDNSVLQRVKQRYGIVGNCEALNRAIEIALKIAPVDLSVLVIGENGVGKESFPRIIHDNSLRSKKKYFAVNCGAIPEGTIDSELFGHEKGAFTGAVEQREGYFAAANGGTLFLDEVGELPLQTQTRLLRVLETGEYIRVGSNEVRKTDVRIVAATNVNMEQAVADGRFREDLYYRLNAIPISVPALRYRGHDVALLFRKFALDMSEKYKMPPIRLTEEAQEVLEAYSWPGNVRQLKNITENMSITAEARDITPQILSLYLPKASHSTQMVLLKQDGEHEKCFESEREMLYQIIMELRRDVADLKRIVYNGRDNASADIRSAGTHELQPVLMNHKEPLQLPTTPESDNVRYWEAEEIKEEETSVAPHAVAEPQEANRPPQSLDEVEREMIRHALQSNHGRRKAAAEQLGISERTLYRKIKEYNLE